MKKLKVWTEKIDKKSFEWAQKMTTNYHLDEIKPYFFAPHIKKVPLAALSSNKKYSPQL